MCIRDSGIGDVNFIAGGPSVRCKATEYRVIKLDMHRSRLRHRESGNRDQRNDDIFEFGNHFELI